MTPKDAFQRIESVIDLADDSVNTNTATGRELEEAIISINDNIKLVRQSLTELEELKKRDTPMKLTQASRFTTDKKLYGMYACNSCHEVIPYITLNSKRVKPKFCYHCGQRLDWSDGK